MSEATEDFAELVQSPTVDILVIPNANDHSISRLFSLPEELLRKRSGWFKTRLAGNRKNGDDIHIKGFTYEAFNILTHWLYTGRITDTSGDESRSAGRSPVSYLLQAWLLFDYFNMPAEQNLVMGRMCRTAEKWHLHDRLTDEDDALAARDSGHVQLTRFV